MIWHSFYAFHPHLFVQECLGFHPRPVQSRFLRHRHRQSLLNCSRQWDRWCVPATDCPHFPPGFLHRERRAMGDYWFRQEYLCEFTQSETGFFPRRLLEDILISMEGQ